MNLTPFLAHQDCQKHAAMQNRNGFMLNKNIGVQGKQRGVMNGTKSSGGNINNHRDHLNLFVCS